MDPETKNLLIETNTLVKENHILLKKLRRGQVIASITRWFYWIVILGLSFGAFYFIQPYLSSLLSIYTGKSSDVGAVLPKNIDIGNITNLLKQLQSGK